MIRSRRAVLGVRTGLVGFLLAGTLVVSTGVAVTPSGAVSGAFCSSIFTFAKAEPNLTQELSSGNYAAWAKATLPYVEKIDAAAPAGKDKAVFNAVVAVYKYLANDKSSADLVKYLKLNQAKLQAATKAVAKSVESCA
jgi:hypothetical protein